MRYLIDVGHPAHVHYFKNFAASMESNGHEVLFTCRDKELTIDLLKYYGFNFVCFGRPFKSILGKAIGLLYFTFRSLLTTIRFKPVIVLNASMYAAIAAWIMRKHHISLEDTFNYEQVRLYLPFTDCVLTGNYLHPSLGSKEIQFNGYQELLYLHPKRFHPDPSILEELGVKKNEPFVIIRFVSWSASHDIGHKGISLENKLHVVKAFSKYARVFISSEVKLPNVLEKYRFNLPPHKMHHAMAFSTMIFGESATMVSEGAMLGVPGIFLDKTGRYYTRDLENRYGLVFNFTESKEDQKKAINKGIELLCTPEIKFLWKTKRDIMLKDKIDVSAFLIWFVEDYPNSKFVAKENPNFQYAFR